jgi:hypothetical protein
VYHDCGAAHASRLHVLNVLHASPGDPVMPFANLRDGDWQRKRHGIREATSEAARSTEAAPKKTK